jgi:hypothetical protein
MAQAVSRRPLTVEVWVRAQASPRGICGGQSGTAAGLFRVPCYTVALRAHISSGGWRVGPLVAAVQRHSLTPLTCATALQKVEFYNAAFRVYSMVLRHKNKFRF